MLARGAASAACLQSGERLRGRHSSASASRRKAQQWRLQPAATSTPSYIMCGLRGQHVGDSSACGALTQRLQGRCLVINSDHCCAAACTPCCSGCEQCHLVCCICAAAAAVHVQPHLTCLLTCLQGSSRQVLQAVRNTPKALPLPSRQQVFS